MGVRESKVFKEVLTHLKRAGRSHRGVPKGGRLDGEKKQDQHAYDRGSSQLSIDTEAADWSTAHLAAATIFNPLFDTSRPPPCSDKHTSSL